MRKLGHLSTFHISFQNLGPWVADNSVLFQFCADGNEKSKSAAINPIQDGLFWGCSRMGAGPFLPSIPKIRHTYPTMMKLGTVILYQRKIQKMYKSRDIFLEFCWHQHFSSEISKFCYIKKHTYRLDFEK